MTPLVVEWRHLSVEGETCERCGCTGANVRAAVEAMAPVLSAQGIALELCEVELPPGEIAHSNEVLVDGALIEELIGGETAVSDCASCGDLVGAPCACRTVTVGGEEHEELPESLIAAAIMTAADRRAGAPAAGGDRKQPPPDDDGGCGCGGGGTCCG